jgi:hypothetical protein
MNRSRLDMKTAMASTATIAAVPPFGSGSGAADEGDLLPSLMEGPLG